MIVLDSEQIDKLIDRNEMMDQIEEAYKILKQVIIICRRARVWKMQTRR